MKSTALQSFRRKLATGATLSVDFTLEPQSDISDDAPLSSLLEFLPDGFAKRELIFYIAQRTPLTRKGLLRSNKGPSAASPCACLPAKSDCSIWWKLSTVQRCRNPWTRRLGLSIPGETCIRVSWII